MDYELYWISGSPFAWMAALALEIKKVAYTSHRLDPSKAEHKAPDYLAINPRGKVPALKNGETVVYESIAILNYLDRMHPEPALFGTTPRETGLVWQRWSEIHHYSREAISTAIIAPIFRGRAGEDATAIKAALPALREALAWGEDILGDTAYLAGKTISVADVAYLPLIASLARALGREDVAALDFAILPLDESYPNTAAWLARMEEIPGYDNAYPPHWKQ